MALDGAKVGFTPSADGTTHDKLRLGKTLEQISGQAHGLYYEPVSRGTVYHASMQAGAALGTALTATAVTLTLYNPLNSGVNLVLLEVGVNITTYLAAAGTSVYALAGNVLTTAAAPATTTAATVRSCLLGGSAGRGVAYTAATLPSVPVVLKTVGSLHLVGGTPVSESSFSLIDYTDGKIVLQPNTAVTLQGIGTASSGIVHMIWEEVAVS
jgi:hypothetical protein